MVTEPRTCARLRSVSSPPDLGRKISLWSDDAEMFFDEALGDVDHSVKVVSESKFVDTVEIRSIAQKLVDAGFAKWKAVTAKSSRWTSAPIDSAGTSRSLREMEAKKSTSRQMTGAGSSGFAATSGGFAARSGSFAEDWTTGTDNAITSFNNKTSRPPRESETKSPSWQPSAAGSGSFAAASSSFAERSGGFAPSDFYLQSSSVEQQLTELADDSAPDFSVQVASGFADAVFNLMKSQVYVSS